MIGLRSRSGRTPGPIAQAEELFAVGNVGWRISDATRVDDIAAPAQLPAIWIFRGAWRSKVLGIPRGD